MTYSSDPNLEANELEEQFPEEQFPVKEGVARLPQESQGEYMASVMALPSSGPLSLLDIAGEFGGSTPHGLSEYYAAASGVPSSGTISIGNFYGKSAVTGDGGEKYVPGDGYTYHVYNVPGWFIWNGPTSTRLDYLIIGGGGGGAGGDTSGYGGGGAGAYYTGAKPGIAPGGYMMEVGAGGTSNVSGGTTAFASGSPYVTYAPGGGSGGTRGGMPGACGGGATGPDQRYGIGNVGYPGGGKSPTSPGSSWRGSDTGGGGGGMSSRGFTGGSAPPSEDRSGASGGRGLTVSPLFNGLPAPVVTPGQPGRWVCGGGGGGASGNRSTASGAGGRSYHGGGRGGPSRRAGSNANSRGAGGGGGSASSGGKGSPGIVVIRYIDPDTGGGTPPPSGGQGSFESWATSNGYTLVVPACTGTVWGDPYSRVTSDSAKQKLCYMSIESSYAASVINGGGKVGYKTTLLGNYSSYSSVNRNSCSSNNYTNSWQGMRITVVYYVPSNGIVRQKNYTNGFSTVNI